MKKVNTESRRETITDAVKEILASNDEIKGIKEKNDTMAEQMKTLLAAVQSLANNAMSAEEKKQQAEADEAKRMKALEEKDPAQAVMLKAMNALADRLEKMEGGTGRKGHQEDDEDTDGGETIKKCLKSVGDADSIKYVLHVMGDGKEAGDTVAWESLTDGEKEKAKSIYAQAFFANISQ